MRILCCGASLLALPASASAPPSAAPQQSRCWHHAKLRHRHRYLLDSVLNHITHRRFRIADYTPPVRGGGGEG